MDGLFDPAEYLVWPGTNGGMATDRATLKDRVCRCGNPLFEVAAESRVDRQTGERREDVTLRCCDCFRKTPAKILGHVNVQTMEAREAWMQEHHRKLIEQEAENWRVEPRQPTTERDVYIYDIGDGMMVVLAEKANHDRRSVDAYFDGTDMPLTAPMVRARFANPFGGT